MFNNPYSSGQNNPELYLIWTLIIKYCHIQMNV
jgi:hypothetical protein